MNSPDLVRRFYPEANVGGFSHVDGSVAFFTQIAAVLKPTDRVLDFGAGRGEPLIDDPVDYRRELGTLQNRCAHLEGCDIDPVVLTNPFLDHAEVITLGDRLPYPDESFDIIVARAVFEHVEDPVWLASELLRILKPGGLIAATTPNKFGYIALAARMVPNRLHVKALTRIQPSRKAADVFPTYYRMNTRSALRRVFGAKADLYLVYMSSEPAYHFGKSPIYRIFMFLNKHLPSRLQPALLVYIRKHHQ